MSDGERPERRAGADLRTVAPPLPPLPYAAVALAAASWGTWGLIIRRTHEIGTVPAALESAIVMAVVTVISGIACRLERGAARATIGAVRVRLRPTPAQWACIAWFGVGDLINILLFFAAYKLTIAVAVLTHYLTPIFVALTAPILLKEKMTSHTGVAVVASFAGLAVMLAPSPGAASSAAVWTSAALGTGSAVFYASNVLVNKVMADAFSPSEAMFWHGVVATAVGVLLVPRAAWVNVDGCAAAFLAVLAIGPGALGGLSFLWGLRRMPAAHASTLTLIEPLVSVLLGAAALGEHLGPRALLGGTLILAGALRLMTQPATAAGAAASRRNPG